jgi:hypothetical protein
MYPDSFKTSTSLMDDSEGDDAAKPQTKKAINKMASYY